MAELIFMRKAAALGFSVSKPWGEGERYDAIVRVGTKLWRVQVKSVLAKPPSRHHYGVTTSAGRAGYKYRPYTSAEIDFLAAYIFPENLWYVFPTSVIEREKALCVWPGSKKSRLEQYREAWHLMKPPSPEAADASALTAAIGN